LGGNGPWIPKVDGIVTNDTAPPQGCMVQQVHMVIIYKALSKHHPKIGRSLAMPNDIQIRGLLHE
jgi:hypothetical protein